MSFAEVDQKSTFAEKPGITNYIDALTNTATYISSLFSPGIIPAFYLQKNVDTEAKGLLVG